MDVMYCSHCSHTDKEEGEQSSSGLDSLLINLALRKRRACDHPRQPCLPPLNPAPPTQIYFYIFDFVPVFFTFFFFTIWHYGLWLGPATLESVPPCGTEQSTLPAAEIGTSSAAASSDDLMEKGKVAAAELELAGSYRPAAGAVALGTPVLPAHAMASATGVQLVHVSPRQSEARS